MRIHLSPPHLGAEERALLCEAFDSNWVAPLGPMVDGFEADVRARTGCAAALATSSGTAALELALRALGVGAGDRVVVSTLTFVASANPIRQVGAEPVFVDAEPDSWNLDPVRLAEALDRLAAEGTPARAVIAVDLYGQCADYDRILPICAAHGVPLIEDAAEALGADHRGRAAGRLGVLGVFSFNGNKIITTGGGGMLIGDRPDLIARARHLSTQAREPAPHYEHRELGFNYRLSNLLAAVGRGQLARLDDRVARRRAIHARYRAGLGDLAGVGFQPEAGWGTATFWLTCVTIDAARFGADRDAVLAALAADDVEARPAWKPMHLQPAFRDARCFGGEVAAGVFARGLCLPSGSALSEADQDRVIAGVRAARGRA